MDLRQSVALELIAKRTAAASQDIKSYCPHEPTTKQQAFVADDCQEALFGGAAGGGKSDAMLMASLKFVHVPRYAGLLLRQSYTDLALPGAIMDRSHAWLSNTDAHWDGINKRWTFPSGAVLGFGYLEGPRDHYRYQSAEFQFIGFDELTQFTEEQYTYMFSRLRAANVAVPLRMRGATNPGGMGHDWVKKRFGIPEEVEPERIYSHSERKFYPARVEDNKHIDIDGYRRSLAQLNFVTRAQLEKGLWRRDTSTLVSQFDEDRDCIDALPQLPAGMTWTNVLGIDYGNVNATALVVNRFCLPFSDIVYTAESQKWEGLDPTGAAEIVNAWSKRYGGFAMMVGDVGGLGKGYAEEARNRWALPIEPAEKQNKYGYIKLLNGAYQHLKKKIVRATNLDLIAEKKSHPWKDGKQYLEEQPGSPNHLMDADLYGWRACIAWGHRSPPPAPPKHGTPEFYAKEEQRIRQQHIAEASRDIFAADPWAHD